MSTAPKMIVMLTNNDLTTPDALELFEGAKEAPADYWGFKDVGIPYEALEELHTHMKRAGKTTFIEIVKETPEELMESVRFAAKIKADYLLHTKYTDEIQKVCSEGGVKYMPSLGTHVEHKLTGSVEDIVAEARELEAKGVYGFKLSAYRYIDGDPDVLLNRVMSAVNCHACVTGSVNDYERLEALKKNRVEMFTMGGALYNHKFGGSFAEQITNVVEFLNRK